jgi:hypothetical protein
MGAYRRGKITSPATANVVDIEFNENNRFDRRSVDDSLTASPVKTKKEGSGSFTLRSGTMPQLYNHSLVMTVEDVAVTDGTETITSRTFTFANVSSNRGLSANNDGGESSGKIAFDFSSVTES